MRLAFTKVPVVAALVLLALVQPSRAVSGDFSSFGAVGSWYGKAVQLCSPGSAPSACAGGLPAVTMFVTATLTGEGLFVGDDSLVFANPPFSPHTAAHGQWFPTSPNQFIADYVFLSEPYPPVPNSVAGFKARWVAQVVDHSTILGWINLFITPAVPLQWQAVGPSQFPVFPPEAARILAPADPFIFDPVFCAIATGTNCPLVFKFTLARVGP